ncbi:MAG: Gmad2 immunoglobulin-like domain-containing protein [Candidatus Paceibacterota bacterium]
MKKLIIILVLLVVLGGGWYFINQQRVETTEQLDTEAITSFEECEAAGYPIQESYPRRCALPDGRVYAEEIEVQPTYTNANEDLIKVENPHPGGVVGKEFVVTGEARGYWFFEATFPIEVVGATGDIIAGSYATANGDWMTEEFVSFTSEIIDLPSAYVGPATLILHRSNASGLPEHDASISIPIVVEY